MEGQRGFEVVAPAVGGELSVVSGVMASVPAYSNNNKTVSRQMGYCPICGASEAFSQLPMHMRVVHNVEVNVDNSGQQQRQQQSGIRVVQPISQPIRRVPYYEIVHQQQQQVVTVQQQTPQHHYQQELRLTPIVNQRSTRQDYVHHQQQHQHQQSAAAPTVIVHHQQQQSPVANSYVMGHQAASSTTAYYPSCQSRTTPVAQTFRHVIPGSDQTVKPQSRMPNTGVMHRAVRPQAYSPAVSSPAVQQLERTVQSLCNRSNPDSSRSHQPHSGIHPQTQTSVASSTTDSGRNVAATMFAAAVETPTGLKTSIMTTQQRWTPAAAVAAASPPSRGCYLCFTSLPNLALLLTHERQHVLAALDAMMSKRRMMESKTISYIRHYYPLMLQRKVVCQKCLVAEKRARTGAQPKYYLSSKEQEYHVASCHSAHTRNAQGTVNQQALTLELDLCFPLLSTKGYHTSTVATAPTVHVNPQLPTVPVSSTQNGQTFLAPAKTLHANATLLKHALLKPMLTSTTTRRCSVDEVIEDVVSKAQSPSAQEVQNEKTNRGTKRSADADYIISSLPSPACDALSISPALPSPQTLSPPTTYEYSEFDAAVGIKPPAIKKEICDEVVEPPCKRARTSDETEGRFCDRFLPAPSLLDALDLCGGVDSVKQWSLTAMRRCESRTDIETVDVVYDAIVPMAEPPPEMHVCLHLAVHGYSRKTDACQLCRSQTTATERL